MQEYDKIPYASFLWKLGNTSFRTRTFNKMTELQLRLLDDFWAMPENKGLGWEIVTEGQVDIYDVKNRYYDWLVAKGFTKGDDKIKYKAAREKTSGLYAMGLINREHRLTEVGKELLDMAEDQSYLEKTPLGIPKDSLLYLQQLLKLGDNNTGKLVRPLIVVIHLLAKLDYLTNDEFRYLAPLCTDKTSTERILHCIQELRHGKGSTDRILVDFLLTKKNYKEGRQRFVENEFSEDLLLSVSMNRKSATYDKAYTRVYRELHAVYMEHDDSRILPLFESFKRLQPSISSKWKTLLFNTNLTSAVKASPLEHLLPLPLEAVTSEATFKDFFFKTMHLNKAKATLEDYRDLNQRYLGLTNCFIFADNRVILDVVPKYIFGRAITQLYEQAFQKSELLFRNSTLEEICPTLAFDEKAVINGLNQELGTSIVDINEAYDEVDRIRYKRLNTLIDERFDDKTLLNLLHDFEVRNDKNINLLVTDNADIPTIFEYILGIIWYKTSERRGKLLDYLKLSLDANLLPVTHAAGGEADIVYEYDPTSDYPAHHLLLEATLADGTNQRRMEMEPVSRHVGNHLLRTGNKDSYGIFMTTYLHINVISDFKCRKHVPYFDVQNTDQYIAGMKITPLDTQDLKAIIAKGIKYKELYGRFEQAYREADDHPNPKEWYENLVCLH